MGELRQLKAQLQAENLIFREEVDRGAKHADIVGWSAPLARVLEQVATTSSTVLVSGETGKGKELIARAIYQRSNLRKRLFVTMNCAALPAIP
jgi:formate hydrogenlyase transcriptional activator